jgi:hypothetical protein
VADPPDPRKSNPPDPESLAAEGEGGSNRNLEARLERYGRAKARSHQMAGYVLQAKDDDLSRKLYGCGSFLHFREWAAHDNKRTLSKGHFCQVPLLCPLCAIRRGGKLLRRYVERANYLLRDHDAYMVTLTVKNGPDLAERFGHLRSAWRKFRERAKKGYSELAKAKGYVGSFEFTRNAETGEWHPHLHMVWFVPRGTVVRYGEGSQLREDWHAITGDSFITHAKRIEIEAGGDPASGGAPAALLDAFCEVLKYALKFSTLPLADNLAAYRTLKGKRLMTSGGCVYGLELPEDAKLEDDPLDGPFVEVIYRYAGGQGYVLHDSWLGEERPLRGPSSGTTVAPHDDHSPCPQALSADQGHADCGPACAPPQPVGAARPGAGVDRGHRGGGVRPQSGDPGGRLRGDDGEGHRAALTHARTPARGAAQAL